METTQHEATKMVNWLPKLAAKLAQAWDEGNLVQSKALLLEAERDLAYIKNEMKRQLFANLK